MDSSTNAISAQVPIAVPFQYRSEDNFGEELISISSFGVCAGSGEFRGEI